MGTKNSIPQYGDTSAISKAENKFRTGINALFGFFLAFLNNLCEPNIKRRDLPAERAHTHLTKVIIELCASTDIPYTPYSI